MNISKEQINNIIRHLGTFAGGALAFAGALAVISGSQAADAQVALQDVIAGLTQAFSGFWKLGIILGPAIAVVMGRWGWHVVSPAAQAKALGNTQPEGSVKVMVSPAAPEAVQAVAKSTSPSTKNVEMSPPTVVIDKKVTR